MTYFNTYYRIQKLTSHNRHWYFYGWGWEIAFNSFVSYHVISSVPFEKQGFLCHAIDSFQIVKLAKRLKKEKVNVDIINFGEEVSCVEMMNIYVCMICASKVTLLTIKK